MPDSYSTGSYLIATVPAIQHLMVDIKTIFVLASEITSGSPDEWLYFDLAIDPLNFQTLRHL